MNHILCVARMAYDSQSTVLMLDGIPDEGHNDIVRVGSLV